MTDVAAATVGRVSRRLLSLLCLVYLIAYIDRQNVSYAKLQMAADIGLGEAAFGLGAALFFIGYFLFEVPSNLILTRVGAGRWFARIVVSWGAVTIALGFTTNAAGFYALRFLLGVAEAGLFPGVLYAITLWYPHRYRARAIGAFLIAGAVANIVGAMIGGVLLDLDGWLGLRGWQWLFIVTGAPAILLAPVVIAAIPAGPADAPWLNEAERDWLTREIAADASETRHDLGWKALGDGRVVLLCLTFIGFPLAAYGLSYWLPTIVSGFGVSNSLNGVINAALWAQVGVALWLVPRWAARQPDRSWPIIACALTGALALIASVTLPGALPKFLALCLAASAIFSGQPIFWTLPARFLSGAGAAAGLAMINATGNLGGFAAQALVPHIAERSGSALAPMLLLAGALVAVSASVTLLQRRLRAERRG